MEDLNTSFVLKPLIFVVAIDKLCFQSCPELIPHMGTYFLGWMGRQAQEGQPALPHTDPSLPQKPTWWSLTFQ